MADGGLRRTRQRPAPDIVPVARNQEVALIVALIKEPKQVIFAAIGQLKPGLLVRIFPLMKPVNVSGETVSGRKYFEAAIRTSVFNLGQFGQGNRAFDHQFADAVSGRPGNVESGAGSPGQRISWIRQCHHFVHSARTRIIT